MINIQYKQRITNLVLILLTAIPAGAVIHLEGDTQYMEDFGPSSRIAVSGGTAAFRGKLQNNVIVEVTGGMASFYGEIRNGAVFNLSGGATLIDTLKNNATLNVTGNAQLTLANAVGNSASVQLSDTGTLVLDGNDIFANSSELIASGGTILTQGNDVTFDTAILTGTTTIDLGSAGGTLDLGGVSGDGEIVFSNWSPETTITFAETSTINPETQLVFEGTGTFLGSTGSAVSPVPEPAHTAAAVMLAAGVMVMVRRRRMAA